MTSADKRRFEFGKNWSRYVNRSLNPERVEIAKQHLLKFLRRDDLKGLDFLDIGCGSGIHSLAAFEAGASKVYSFDYDADSVAATNIVRKSAGAPANWSVARADVLDNAYVKSLGKWRLVYSWGVLHHTGDVWQALANAQSAVADGGIFYIALYSADVQTDPKFWLRIKREYNESGALKRWRMVWWYVWVYIMNRRIGQFPDLIKRIVQHRFGRGMSFFTDIRDWLGGWPMEFVHDKDVIEFLEQKHGFRLANIKPGEACTEFVFERVAK
jgi:SAM-dependent methyltransferase